MRNLLALIGLAVVVFGGVGWYMGWYKLNVNKGTDGNLQINANVDTKKVGTDVPELFKTVGTVINTQVDKTAKDAQAPAPTTAPGATPGPLAPQGWPLPAAAPTNPPPAVVIPPAPPETQPAPPVRREFGPIPLFAPKQ